MHSEIRWTPQGSFQPLRYRPGGIGNWSGHLPFAGDLVAALRPSLFVELGTHYGESYFGFCQAIAEHNIPCPSYAVDTWLGEEQAGCYGENVFQDVQAYNEAHYKSFSYLLRTTFDQAIGNFSDDSIDILHIDGLHTYDAVCHDFGNWLPKIRPGGVLLLHDVVARHSDFGVWKLWEELAGLGDRFLFPHSWGLGVFRKPAASLTAADPLSFLFDANLEQQEHLKKFYALCALKLETDHHPAGSAAIAPLSIGAQLFPHLDGQYSHEHRYDASYQSGQWRLVRVELSAGFGNGPLRVDLAQQACIMDVAGITLRKAVGEEIHVAWVGSDVASLKVGGDMSVLEIPANAEFCRFLSTGNDPQLYLPALADGLFDQPFYLEIWVRSHVEVASILQLLKTPLDRKEQSLSREVIAPDVEVMPAAISPDPAPEIDPNAKAVSECNAALEELKLAHARLLKDHETAMQEKTLLAQSYRKLQSDLYVANTELNASRANSQRQANEDAAQRDELVHARNVSALRCQQLEQTIQQMTASRSWRITAPLRNVKRGAAG